MQERKVRSNLIKTRLSLGLSQKKLADQTGTNQAYISQLETCYRDPGRSMAKRIATALEMPDRDSWLFDEGIIEAVQFSAEVQSHDEAS